VIDSEDFRKVVNEDLLRLAAENKLSSLEKPKAIHLTLDPFTTENDIITPTFKLKRNVAKKVYQSEIDKMYAHLKEMGL
jgi:long-chain acyl-CoA synthetase